jgi:histidinol phosphatase-like PHP family hydrolase
MAFDAFARLPDELLDWFGVMTHLHPGGNSECSGQQTPAEIAQVLAILGVQTGIVTPHTGNPTKPYLLDSHGVEEAVLKEIADEVTDTRSTGFDLRFGLECNTVPSEPGGRFGFDLDVSDEFIVSLGSTYTIGSLHGSSKPYKDPGNLVEAIATLCSNPHVDALGHITRYVSDVEVNWLSICKLAAESRTLVELNLNLWFKELGQNDVKPADDFNSRFHQRFLGAVAESGVDVVIGVDAHNLGMYPRPWTDAGWETTVERCLAFVDAISDAGIERQRVISSGTSLWDAYFSQPKHQR